jgi:anti-sigma regulatory factor (Ser/Thr protein kinase)
MVAEAQTQTSHGCTSPTGERRSARRPEGHPTLHVVPRLSEPVQTWPVRRAFPAKRSEVGSARRFLRTLLEDLPQFDADTSELVLSELVTNGIVGTDAPRVWVQCKIVGGRLRLTVSSQPKTQMPIGLWAREAAADEINGRGLFIVDAVSAAWGHRQSRDYRWIAVWADMEPEVSEDEGDTSGEVVPPLPSRKGAVVGRIGTPGRELRVGQLSETDVGAIRAVLGRLPPDFTGAGVAEDSGDGEGRLGVSADAA